LEEGDESVSEERSSGLASEEGEVAEKDCSKGLGSRSKSDLLVEVVGWLLALEEGWLTEEELAVADEEEGGGRE
jgi:hypothetical protein